VGRKVEEEENEENNLIMVRGKCHRKLGRAEGLAEKRGETETAPKEKRNGEGRGKKNQKKMDTNPFGKREKTKSA